MPNLFNLIGSYKAGKFSTTQETGGGGAFIIYGHRVMCIYGTANYRSFWINQAMKKIANQDIRAHFYKYKRILLLTLILISMGLLISLT